MTLALTEVLGAEVRDPAGRRLGRLADLVASCAIETPLVTRVIVRCEDGVRRMADWEAVTSLAGSRTVLRDANLGPVALGGDEIALMKDVVDTQIVDEQERHIVRVADVELERSAHELRVVAVDIGSAALLRRLGLRRLAARGSRDVIAWADLYALHPGQPLHSHAGRQVTAHHGLRHRFPHRILRRRRHA